MAADHRSHNDDIIISDEDSTETDAQRTSTTESNSSNHLAKLGENELKGLLSDENKKNNDKQLLLLWKTLDAVRYYTTKSALVIRDYKLLRPMKRKGIFWRITRPTSLAQVLFPDVVSPQEYKRNEEMKIFVDLVESKNTQLPFQYYDLPACLAPPSSPNINKKFSSLRQRQRQRIVNHNSKKNNLGSRLQGYYGNKLEKSSPFQVYAKLDVPCTPLCVVQMKREKLRWLRKLILRQYRVRLTLDELPVLVRNNKERNFVVEGYPVGFVTSSARPYYYYYYYYYSNDSPGNDVYLYNHLKFTISYNENRDTETLRVIGFDVQPLSVKHNLPDKEFASTDEDVKVKMLDLTTQLSSCHGELVEDPNSYLRLSSDVENLSVVYSYEVKWIKTEIKWSDRWDIYVLGSASNTDDDIQYWSMINSLVIATMLTALIAIAMIRIFRKDIAGYDKVASGPEEIIKPEMKWILLDRDVFRPPQFSPMFLSVLVGTGTQIGVASLCVTLCSTLHLMLNPMIKGQLLTAIIVLYVLSGSVAGYVGTCFMNSFHHQEAAWKESAILTATLLPGLLFVLFCILNFFLSVVGAATAMGFWMIVTLFLLWTCVYAPLVLLGSFLGSRAKNKMKPPTETNRVARVVPDSPRYLHPMVAMLLGGIFPFCCIVMQLRLAMNALWLHQFYYNMGFLLPVLCLLTATCVPVAMTLCFFQLCAEDHRWWWRSFWNCASSGFYVFLYSLYFLSRKLELVGLLPVFLYLTYMIMISVCVGIFCGAVGVLSSFWFVRTIYGARRLSTPCTKTEDNSA